MTVNRIQEWYSYWTSKGEGVYYSWSGGKDSTVLRHIIKTELPYLDIKGVFVDTGLEYTELKEFVKQDPDVIILRPEKPFWQVVRDYGYPVISKEVSECICNARKHLNGGGYDQHYRKLCGLGEYATKSPKSVGHLKEKEFP